MKPTFVLASMVLLSGCASVDPSKVSIAVQPTTTVCGAHDGKIPVVLHIRNDSRGVLRMGVRSDAGPPFEVSWLYFEVLDPRAGDGVDVAHGPGDHGPMPASTLRIGPGDATSVSAAIYGLTADEYARSFRIRLEDLDAHAYTTDAFLPCVRPAPQA